MDDDPDPDLVDALAADASLTCVVGAGGKKSTLYELAGRLERAVVTATVRIPIFDRQVAAVRVTEDPADLLERADAGEADGAVNGLEWPLGLVPEQERDDRYLGYEPDVVDRIAAASSVDHVLVKADGARTRLLKAPNEREPQLPETVDTVLAIASVDAVGRPLDEGAVHRPERVAAVTGRDLGDTIRPDDVATILTSPDGGLKDVPPDATYVPVLNMVDDADDRAVAREVATRILERSADAGAAAHGRISRVVLTSMIADEPLVDVLE
ncbi:putative selenium-dependent hydroxylase accessory protein YqeC [Haloterrigena sp. SYSU A558-1]|uniref:Selenium-dependent hydroxylase accessory protein YqeC n=1 Tax=Haloterrigena gelatinilytica TaxID=2741724 RepID=A0A8J8GMI1_9EURY|nr:selenium cofactor biosynthesis protein YqeC [Haloterrigena gelatinilytica]NUB92401.1 putative selenium-dependent hydroxylase accessory protein YqeC [Haloterrigena gelatinilytica]NUC71772.1 putative selenium-dependent hydroxylase accessory protein YqeC [Haloterrigena gelatinilytica]